MAARASAAQWNFSAGSGLPAGIAVCIAAFIALAIALTPQSSSAAPSSGTKALYLGKDAMGRVSPAGKSSARKGDYCLKCLNESEISCPTCMRFYRSQGADLEQVSCQACLMVTCSECVENDTCPKCGEPL